MSRPRRGELEMTGGDWLSLKMYGDTAGGKTGHQESGVSVSSDWDPLFRLLIRIWLKGSILHIALAQCFPLCALVLTVE